MLASQQQHRAAWRAGERTHTCWLTAPTRSHRPEPDTQTSQTMNHVPLELAFPSLGSAPPISPASDTQLSSWLPHFILSGAARDELSSSSTSKPKNPSRIFFFPVKTDKTSLIPTQGQSHPFLCSQILRSLPDLPVLPRVLHHQLVPSHQATGSQPAQRCSPGTSGNVQRYFWFSQVGNATTMEWIETKDAAKYPITQRTPSTPKISPGHVASSATAETALRPLLL